MKNLAPEIFRQRLLIEGYYSADVTREFVEEFLNSIAARLGLRAYGSPVVFSPGGEGRHENQGFDAFLPLVDSGISAYVWSNRKFASVLLYTCKQFDEHAAIAYTKERFRIAGEIASVSF